MPRAYLPTGTYKRDNGNFPPFRIINVYAEQTPTSDTQVALISRPGLGLLSTVGSGPINGLFSKAGTLSGDVFSLSGSALYRGTSSIGALAGTGVVSFAGGYGEILVCRGSTMRRYNGSISNVTFPDSAGVRAVCFIGSLFVAVRADDSAKFYWSAPLDGSSWDALDFATAEREPDQLLDIASLGDNSGCSANRRSKRGRIPGMRTFRSPGWRTSRSTRACDEHRLRRCGRQRTVLRRLQPLGLPGRGSSRKDFRSRHRGTDSRFGHSQDCSRSSMRATSSSRSARHETCFTTAPPSSGPSSRPTAASGSSPAQRWSMVAYLGHIPTARSWAGMDGTISALRWSAGGRGRSRSMIR
jgi:hypothetical protein